MLYIERQTKNAKKVWSRTWFTNKENVSLILKLHQTLGNVSK